MVLELGTDDLKAALGDLATTLRSVAIPGTPEGAQLARKRDWVVRTIDGFLLPRMDDPAAPLTVVFAGPTGAGKSTLLNSVAGAEHSVAGPLRPTTKAPLVLATSSLANRYSTIAGIRCHVVKGKAPILNLLTLVDTPDIDSTANMHRAIAETMIDNADVVVYVNSSLRYSDLVPWEVLRRAHSRGAPVIHVLNRLKSSSPGALAAYTARLREEGLGSEVVGVHEHLMPRGGQSVPLVMIQDLRDHLMRVVEDIRAGSVDISRSVLATVVDQASDVLEAVKEIRSGRVGVATKADDTLTVDLGRITSPVVVDAGRALGYADVAALEGSRFLPTWRVRRRLPTAARVEHGHRLVDAALVGVIDSDIVGRLEDLVAPHEIAGLSRDAHAAVASAVAAWHADLLRLPLVVESIEPHLAAGLTAWCAIRGQDEGACTALRVLSGAKDLTGPLARARDMLELHLVPVYSGIEYRVGSRLGVGVATDVEVYRARTTLSAVIARSSFANA